jgi:segregation and condensation protein A
MDYKVKFEVFEGPLDLLLYLIKKQEVDIYQVNLTQLATQFMEYIELMRVLDLEVAGEFLVMAATLMYIKSRELLPADQREPAEGDEDEGDDPRWELIRRLVEYKKFKDAAAQLQALELRQENVFPRLPLALEPEPPRWAGRGETSIFELIDAINAVLKRLGEREQLRDIFEDKWTVTQQIEFLLRTIRPGTEVRFFDLFQGATSRSEVVTTFLALLELIRLRRLIATQPVPFGEIYIARPPEPDASGRPSDTIEPPTEQAAQPEPAATPPPPAPAPLPTR